MAQVTLPYTLTPGTPENVNNLMSNLTALRDGVNTIDTAQIANSAVTLGKLDAATLNLLNTKAVIHVRDEKSSGTNGGTFSSGSWQTRTLNTSKTNTITSASLSSNQISLPSGTYWAQAMASAYRVQAHQAKLYNVTGSADLILGTTAYSIDTTGVGVSNISLVSGLFTLSGTSSVELQHRCAGSSGATYGFGIAGSFSTEIYSEVIIWKVA